jgi:hypothetical protein
MAAELLFDVVGGSTDLVRYSPPPVLALRGSTAPAHCSASGTSSPASRPVPSNNSLE